MKHSDLLKLVISLEERITALEEEQELAQTRTPNFKEMAKRRKQKEPDIDLTKLDEMSDSELVAAALLVGHEHASRAIVREDLIALILGEVDEIEDVLQPIREKTYNFVKGNRSVMKSLVDCDMYCPACPHHKVVDCYTDNHDIVDESHRS